MALTSAALRHVRPQGVAAEIGDPSLTGNVQDETIDYKRASLLIRRFHSIWLDLGLSRIFPADWITPTEQGVAFGELTLRQADALILALEGLTAASHPTWPTPGPGQLSLFGGEL